MYGVGPIYVCAIAANMLMPVSVALPPAEINQKSRHDTADMMHRKYRLVGRKEGAR